jgi:hypothetical protein
MGAHHGNYARGPPCRQNKGVEVKSISFSSKKAVISIW